ncbi:hypothetical protein RhiirB3_441028 [Rhizophagus irregularis]|nr:hypothetical protein RhiirB3_441028 [Rhizophagus irregularis]
MFNFILLLLLLQILTIVKSQLLTPSPSVRTLHSSIYVGKKLYIFGGFRDNPLTDTIENNEKTLFLNLFSSVLSGGVAASYGGEKNDTIYFINNENTTSPSVLTFNTSDNSWLKYSSISVERPIGRNQMRPITDYNGKIYLLAGFPFTTIQDVTRNQGGMFIFDTIELSCVLKDAIDGMLRVEYSATLLPNGIIVYMGGKDPKGPDGKPVADGFRIVYLYNTIDNTWKPQPTFGDSTPNGDNGISSVLGLDGFRIIVFGGHNIDNKMLYVLDTTTFNWYEPNVSGKGPTLKRRDHTANVIGRYMVIAFGSDPNLKFDYKQNGENDVLLLDIGNSSNYNWVNHFDPNAVVPPQSPPQSSPTQYNNKNDTGIIVGVVVGVLGIICIISLCIFFFIKRRKNLLHEKALSIPSNSENVMAIPSDLELSSGRSLVKKS